MSFTKDNRKGKVLDCGNRIKGFEKILGNGGSDEDRSKED